MSGNDTLRRWVMPAEWMDRRLFAPPLLEAKRVSHREWRSLFDGRTLDGWVVTADRPELWSVENGAIKCHGNGGGYLRSVDQFGDFALALEFMVDRGTNSGVFVRWSDLRDPVNTGIEVQVLDSARRERPGKHDSGAIYDLVAPTRNTMRPAGEWNRMVITCSGPFIGVRLNGAPVSEINLDLYRQPRRNPDGTRNKFRYALATLPRRGYIGLQNHGRPAWFRGLRVLPL